MRDLDVFDPRHSLFVVDDGRPYFSKDKTVSDSDQLMEFSLGEEAPGIIIDDVVDIGPNFRTAKKAYEAAIKTYIKTS